MRSNRNQSTTTKMTMTTKWLVDELSVSNPKIKCDKHGEHENFISINTGTIHKKFCTLCIIEKMEELGLESFD